MSLYIYFFPAFDIRVELHLPYIELSLGLWKFVPGIIMALAVQISPFDSPVPCATSVYAFRASEEPCYSALNHIMANGAPIDYSYSPVDPASTRPSTRLSSRISSRAGSSVSWHPKLTLYRLLVIVTTSGLAVAKTATSLLNLNFASITLELILGVVVFLL